MQLKLRRVVRTPRSEMIGLFDLDERDEANQPVNFGLLHVHFLADEVRGTLLLASGYWQRVQHLLWQDQHAQDSLGGLARNRYEAQEANEQATRLIDFADMLM